MAVFSCFYLYWATVKAVLTRAESIEAPMVRRPGRISREICQHLVLKAIWPTVTGGLLQTHSIPITSWWGLAANGHGTIWACTGPLLVWRLIQAASPGPGSGIQMILPPASWTGAGWMTPGGWTSSCISWAIPP